MYDLFRGGLTDLLKPPAVGTVVDLLAAPLCRGSRCRPMCVWAVVVVGTMLGPAIPCVLVLESFMAAPLVAHHLLLKAEFVILTALNVMESKTYANKNFSLFGIMNRTCKAGMGRRLLHMWLKQPLMDVTEINVRLDLVQTFVKDTGFSQDMRQHLKRICDVARMSMKLT
ncbi:DNA mismatch repair protein, MSH2 [Artemisia annua]|uniref:DNA mismatch repair protein, MSH2 n=1 Tax=Artemisia annua TaxID=35608 RepID=A0A2U1L3L0_ARTAN|nr:DNA mismatch repair protein, MSH2 [Artemisia annua]